MKSNLSSVKQLGYENITKPALFEFPQFSLKQKSNPNIKKFIIFVFCILK